jgi:signal transduction histidine kinase
MLKGLAQKNILALAHIGSSIKGVLHNMNSPLTAVLGRSEMLRFRFEKLKGSFADAEINELLEKSINDIEIIIENCTKVNSVNSTLMQKSISCESEDKENLNLSLLFNNELMFMSSNMEFKHNIKKDICIAYNVFIKEAIYVDFSNTFNEILENSIYVLRDSENKKISIKLHSDNNHIIMEFGNSGPGMEPSQKDQIIKSFYGENSNNNSDFSRIGNLLSPYRAKLEIENIKGNNVIKIMIPV